MFGGISLEKQSNVSHHPAGFETPPRAIARRSLTLKRDQEPFSSRFVLCCVPSLVRVWHNSREPIGYEDAQAPGSVPRCARRAGRAARPPHTCPALDTV